MPRSHDSSQPLSDWNPLSSKLNYDTSSLQKQTTAALENALTNFWGYMVDAVDMMLGINLPTTLTGSSDSTDWLTSLTTDLFGSGATSSPTSWTTLLDEIIPGLDASKITTGTISVSLLPTIPQTQIASLEADLDALLPNSTWQTFINGIVGGTAGDVNALVTYLNGVDTAAAAAINTGDWNGLLTALFGGTSVASTVQASAVPGLDASKIVSGSFAQSFVTGLTSSLNALLPNSTYQSLIDGIANSLGHSGTGHTWSDIETYFGIIPGPNIASAVTASVVPSLDASKITTGSFAQSFITGLSSIWTNLFGGGTPASSPLAAAVVPALPASQITSGTFGTALIPALDASKITSGSLTGATVPGSNLIGSVASSLLSGAVALGLIPALPASQITTGAFSATQIPSLDASKITTGTLGSSLLPDITAAMSTDIAGTLNAIGAALGLGGSGNTVSGITAPLAKALGSNQFRAHCTSTAQTVVPTGSSPLPILLDTTDYNVGGYLWNEPTNTLTVPVKGLYAIKLGTAFSVTSTTTARSIAPIIYQNTAVARFGNGQTFASSFTASSWLADTFYIECNANDTIAPGLNASLGNFKVFGDATGAETYLEVTLIRVDN